MNPVVANAVMSVAPELARYAGLYELSPTARSYGAAPSAGSLTFGQATKFSAISTNIVLATTLAGYALDEQITKRLNLPGGWGPVVGAATGLATTNAVAGLSQGVPASLGYLVGSIGPLLPAAFAAYALKKTTKDTGAVYALAGIAAAGAIYGISKGLRK